MSTIAESGLISNSSREVANLFIDTSSIAIDTIRAVILNIFNTCTGGMHQDLNRKAHLDLEKTSRNLSHYPAMELLNIVNPECKSPAEQGITLLSLLGKKDTNDGDSFLGEKVEAYMFKKARAFAENKDSKLHSEVYARAAYFAMAVVVTIAKVVDVMVGILATIGAILTFGTKQKLITLVYHNLPSLNLINTLFRGITGCINPQANSVDRLREPSESKDAELSPILKRRNPTPASPVRRPQFESPDPNILYTANLHNDSVGEGIGSEPSFAVQGYSPPSPPRVAHRLARASLATRLDNENGLPG